ncbi:MAG TPA: SseB family protein [Nocardioidaceae bacterium]|nr:SseB family protein [Nocardioidaceae bacterium]
MHDIPDPGFAGDQGAADPDLRRALAAAAGGGPTGPALALLLRSRLLVPVVAVRGESEPDEQRLAHDKSADMAAVLMTGRDGRKALLAFSGTDALAAWDPQARPVPVAASVAAQAALAEGAGALVVDVAGPAMYVLEGGDLQHAASGSVLVRAGDRYGWTRREGGDGATGPV